MREIRGSGRALARSPRGAAAIAPFPWSSLEPLARIEVEAVRALRQWGRAHSRLDRLGAALEGLLGVPASILVRRAGPSADVAPLPESTRIVVEPQASGPDAEVVLELETALVTTLVSRALRRPPPVLVKPQVVLDGVAGAAAAVLSAALRRAGGGTAFVVRPAPESASRALDAAPSSNERWSVTLTVLLGDEAFAARATFRRTSVPWQTGESHPWTRGALLALGATPLRVPLVAATLTLSATEVASLGPGDVLVPDAGSLTRGGAALAGSAHLAAPGDDVGVRVDLVEGGHVVLRGEREPLCGAEGAMSDEVGGGALVEAIGDVPVVVRVEVGEAVMSARDWASLGPGDVVALGQRVGERVLLRIGGVPVARAELVDIEGEVGVRIVARLAEESTLG
jgi:type III secretion system YscQ/HrcQ family protein